ncbi:MAG: hypothetical protein DRH15_11420 [Deltaproteobacteria bacterium]|nr:MAG: hypothetical protein DRH15_11420 [Deltaproteobacteria bacterium]
MSPSTLCIIVNYKTASLAVGAVQSVRDSESLGPVKIVVVDNSEDKEEARKLRDLLPKDVSLVINGRNVGFGCACNQALRHAGSDYVLLLNPDARLLPGALKALQEIICSRSDCGAVGPQAFLDEGLTHFLPPSCPPWIFYVKEICRGLRHGSVFVQILTRAWRAFALKVWTAIRPVSVPNLSGGHVLLRRAAVRRMGGVLFDPSFFLYFEDTDLFLRMRRGGFRLFHVPGAKVVHPFGQAARKNPMHNQYMAESWERFINKNLLGWRRRIWEAINALKPMVKGREEIPACEFMQGLGPMRVPNRLEDQWLFEWGPNPDFIPAIGTFGRGPNVSIPPVSDGALCPGTYYGRFSRPTRLSTHEGVMQWQM